MPFNFNSSQNSLQLFGGGGIGGPNSPFKIPRVGINFGNSLLGKGINFLFGKAPGDYVKGHPGSGGQIVGFGVRNLKTIFNPNKDGISIKKWPYGDGGDLIGPPVTIKTHPPGFTPQYAFWQKPDDQYQPWKKYGDKTSIPKEKGQIPFITRTQGELGQENISIQKISNTLDYRKAILQKRDPVTEKFSFGLTDKSEQFQIFDSYETISDSTQELSGGLQFQKNISLVSWQSTLSENEDPTILGFDLEIDEVTSPLINGSLERFINQFSIPLDRNGPSPHAVDSLPGFISEISARREIYDEFIKQFKKFFNTNVNSNPNATKAEKNHYITQLKGLDKFGHVKGTGSGDSGSVKLFTDFPSSKVSILINEDVNQNISYLSYLYNILTRSRIEGRRIIPQNLLRFNCRIIVTEMRNYNRVMKVIGNSTTNLQNLRDFGSSTDREEGSYYVLSDLISKKEYNLYECEFSFDNLTHGESLNIGGNSAPSSIAPITIDFNYKFVSSEFHKFSFVEPKNDPKDSFTYSRYNDEYIDPKQLRSIDTNRFKYGDNTNGIGLTNSFISFLNPIPEVFTFDAYPKRGFYVKQKIGELEDLKKNNLLKNFVAGVANRLAGELLRAGANALNREIGKRFALVNKALNERLNRAGLSVSLNTIQNPRNIYNPGSNFRNELSNAIRGFVGRSVGRFFSKPVNTSEANSGYLPQRQGGPFRSSSVYRPTPGTNINRFRATRLSRPRNVYTPRRVANFLSTTSPTDPRRGAASTRTTRSNPFSL